ncbi:Latrophilin Cytoplasmic C-terminal region [Mactra antiquata]
MDVQIEKENISEDPIFLREYNFPGLFACLDNLRLSCPDLVALNENKFTIRSSNSARVINQPEIRTLTSTQCINLLVTACSAVILEDIRWPLTDVGRHVTFKCPSSYQTGLSTICFNGAYYNSPLEFVQKDLSVNGTVESFDGKRLINSNIISIQLDTGVKVNNLSPPVTVKLAIKDTTFTDPACVFLDFNITGDGERVAWSTEGCKLTSYKGTHVTCSCNHLTNFAILMSPSGVSESHTRTLGIISAVGCAISMLCLILTIILHCIVWRLVRSDRAIILMNLCVALLIALGIFLAGVNRTESRIACIIVAALIQFFFLAVFFFMLLIGIEILICVVHVFMTKFRIKILLPLAWVFPALIVGISLGVSKTNGYGNDRFCWLDTGTGLIWAFIGPVAFIILINLIVIVIVFKKMASSHAVKSKSTSIKVK